MLKIVATETGVEFYDESPSFFLQCFDETLLDTLQAEGTKKVKETQRRAPENNTISDLYRMLASRYY